MIGFCNDCDPHNKGYYRLLFGWNCDRHICGECYDWRCSKGVSRRSEEFQKYRETKGVEASDNKRITELEATVEQKQAIIESSCKDTCDFYEELFRAIGITESTDEYKCDEEDILNAIEEQVKRIAELEVK